MDYNYNGKNLEECLEKAASELSIAKDKIDYEVIKEENKFMKKYCEIVVHVQYTEEKKDSIDKRKQKSIENVVIDDCNNLIIKDGIEHECSFEDDIEVTVNGEKVNSGILISPDDKVKVKAEDNKAVRELKIVVAKDKMSASISVSYVPEEKAVINCEVLGGKIKLAIKYKEGEKPPLYTENEIIDALKQKNVVYGIDQNYLKDILKSGDILSEVVAKGTPAINDENDRLDVKFEKSKRNVSASSNKKIDYRNMYTLATVKKGDVLAEVIIGKEGTDGKNVAGVELKHKKKSILKYAAKDGCILEENKIISVMDGRPSVKNGAFYVHKVLETSGDVDMKSGNIAFLGDVKITGNVKQGMKVEAGSGIQIEGNVESADIIGQGEVHINGNVLHSRIFAGSKDFELQDYVKKLTKIRSDIDNLVTSYNEITSKGVIAQKASVGEILKLLIEKKFRELPKRAMYIMLNNEIKSEHNKYIKDNLKSKLIGAGPIGIKYISEMYELIDCIDEEIKTLSGEVMIPVDMHLNYIQESTINGTGDIYIEGKGEYTSTITSKGSLEFISEGAVARGGNLKAEKEIIAKAIGSIAGVSTTLAVPKDGVITAEVAYQNTIFIVGEKRYVLETASKDVKVYLGDDGDIVVDKFVL